MQNVTLKPSKLIKGIWEMSGYKGGLKLQCIVATHVSE